MPPNAPYDPLPHSSHNSCSLLILSKYFKVNIVICRKNAEFDNMHTLNEEVIGSLFEARYHDIEEMH
jgi:hypothetical protein